MKQQQATYSQQVEVVSATDELKKKLENLDIKQLNKVLRYAELQQNRLDKRAKKSGQQSQAVLLIEYRQEENRRWELRKLTGIERSLSYDDKIKINSEIVSDVLSIYNNEVHYKDVQQKHNGLEISDDLPPLEEAYQPK